MKLKREVWRRGDGERPLTEREQAVFALCLGFAGMGAFVVLTLLLFELFLRFFGN